MTLQKSTGAEKSRKERREKHAQLPAQVPASRVSEKLGGNERQEWKDEESCQEDRNHETSDKLEGSKAKQGGDRPQLGEGHRAE